MFQGLLSRTLLILLMPLIFLQIILAYLVFDKHMENITQTAAQDIAVQINTLLDIVNSNKARFYNSSEKIMNIAVSIKNQKPYFKGTEYRHSFLTNTLGQALKEKTQYPFKLTLNSKEIEILIALPEEVVKFVLPTKKLFSRTTRLIVIWTSICAVIFFIIASLFMRNQIKPIRHLAAAADRFGRTQEDFDFIPYGAYEIKKAGNAFNIMKERLLRVLSERMATLATISHDLRTPLARMKLNVAMLPESSHKKDLNRDINDMNTLINTYLNFSRLTLTEETKKINIVSFIKKHIKKYKQLLPIHFESEKKSIPIQLRKEIFSLALDNIIKNAKDYASELWVYLERDKNNLLIHFEDNGPGIKKTERSKVFKPFYRLDTTRQQNTDNVGLGFSIIQDGILSHGGEMFLDDSNHGGLKITIKLSL